MSPPTPKRAIILFSDTGGGHRSSAEALAEAMQSLYPDHFSVQLIDLLDQYTPFPFRRFPAWYPWMVGRKRIWGQAFKWSDGPRRAWMMSTATWPMVRQAMRRLVRERPADVIISVHPLFQIPVMRALGRPRPPYVTVVTDLVSTHAMWYHPRVDLCLVPTERARTRALACGLPRSRVRVVGLPVASRFSRARKDKAALRRELGWREDLPAVLLAGGGDGLGPIAETATAIDNTGLPLQLAMVTGRNEALRQQLAEERWNVPAHIYGFVGNMPDLMGAADLIVTKAGPSSIAEALNTGLPIVLNSALPGQEEGNVTFVVDEGAGVWAPGPEKVADAVRAWLGNDSGDALRQAAQNALRLARPNAAQDAAKEIAELMGLTR